MKEEKATSATQKVARLARAIGAFAIAPLMKLDVRGNPRWRM